MNIYLNVKLYLNVNAIHLIYLEIICQISNFIFYTEFPIYN